jgi:hypothetical protein
LSYGLDTVRAVAEVHGVEIAREDLVFRELLLELHRQQHLADLLLDRARRQDVLDASVRVLQIVARVDLLHELLRDRRSPLHRLVLDDVGPRRARDAERVESPMLVELRVLDRQDGVDEMRRHLAETDGGPVDRAVKRGQQVPVAVVDVGRADRRQPLGELDPNVREDDPGGDEQDEPERNRDEQPPEAPEEALGGRRMLRGRVLGRRVLRSVVAAQPRAGRHSRTILPWGSRKVADVAAERRWRSVSRWRSGACEP